jgi:GTP cyclohydrolase I
MQEYICDRIASLLFEFLEPAGVIVVIRAEHSCMGCRGIAAPGVMTTTSSVKGVFRDVPAARSEFFNLIQGDS